MALGKFALCFISSTKQIEEEFDTQTAGVRGLYMVNFLL